MCEEKEANLVTVNDEDEMNFLGSLMKDKGSWNGLHFNANSEDAIWSSGGAVNIGTGPRQNQREFLSCHSAYK